MKTARAIFRALYPARRYHHLVELELNIGPIQSLMWSDSPNHVRHRLRELGIDGPRRIPTHSIVEITRMARVSEVGEESDTITTVSVSEGPEESLFTQAEDRLTQWWGDADKWDDEQDLIWRALAACPTVDQIYRFPARSILRAAFLIEGGAWDARPDQQQHAMAMLHAMASIKRHNSLNAAQESRQCHGCGEHEAILQERHGGTYCRHCAEAFPTVAKEIPACAGIW